MNLKRLWSEGWPVVVGGAFWVLILLGPIKMLVEGIAGMQ